MSRGPLCPCGALRTIKWLSGNSISRALSCGGGQDLSLDQMSDVTIVFEPVYPCHSPPAMLSLAISCHRGRELSLDQMSGVKAILEGTILCNDSALSYDGLT